MVNFESIATNILNGTISGVFVLRNGREIESIFFSVNKRRYASILYPQYPYMLFGLMYNKNGEVYLLSQQDKSCDIVDFRYN